MHQQRLKVFVHSALELPIQGPIGRNVTDFGKSINWDGKPLPDIKLTRSHLITMRDDKSIGTLDFAIMIAAWGGMKPKHGKLFLKAWKDFPQIHQKIFDQVRAGDEGDHFHRMHQLQLTKVMRGAGIAYFTKFLCFLRPQNDYFILDQWTAKSWNYLCDIKHVKFDGDTVSARNTPKTYEFFCKFIHDLSDVLATHDLQDNSPLNTEMRLFSQGGRAGKALPWREHLRTNYKDASTRFAPIQKI